MKSEQAYAVEISLVGKWVSVWLEPPNDGQVLPPIGFGGRVSSLSPDGVHLTDLIGIDRSTLILPLGVERVPTEEEVDHYNGRDVGSDVAFCTVLQDDALYDEVYARGLSFAADEHRSKATGVRIRSGLPELHEIVSRERTSGKLREPPADSQ